MTAPAVPASPVLAVVLVVALVREFRLRRALQKLVSQILQRERFADGNAFTGSGLNGRRRSNGRGMHHSARQSISLR